jgi:2-keto-4-pentenoate hydratase/2-oxohepta-3-ene-1,7-dioic acid hydratase in catechol pathway
MKIARVETADHRIVYGIVRADHLDVLEGDLFGPYRKTGQSLLLRDVQWLAPVVPPTVLCIGRNYKAHAEEGGAELPQVPLLFIKAASCLTAPGAPIVIPPVAPGKIDYEAELVVVIGKAARNVSEAEALDYVLGYTCGNDISARDCQKSDGQWARAKSFDTFGPVGPWIETDLNPGHLKIQGRLNGTVMQSSSTVLLIFSVRHIISYLSQGMTLQPGTLLFTGTPEGCGFARIPPVWLKAGDVYEVEIEGIGVLRNPVVGAAGH